MINTRNVSVFAAVSADSQRSRRVRSLSLSVAAAMLAGTALVPATAQTFDIGGGPLIVTDFTGPPLNNPTVITNGQLTVDAGVGLAFGGLLNDSLGVLSLTKIGTAALTLSGANNYNGGTQLQAGSLIAGINGAFGTGALAVTGNSALSSSGASRTLANAIVINPGTTLSVSADAAQTMILSGVISGDGVLRSTVAGTTVRLTGANTYTGGTELAGGRLVAGNNAALGTAGVTVTAASTLSSFGANRVLGNAININTGAALSLTSATNQLLTLSGVISGDGELRKGGSGATVRLIGINTYTGGTVLTGGRIEIGNADALSNGAITTQGPNASTIALADPNVGLTLANAINLTGASLSVEAPAGGQILTLAGTITGAATRTLTVSGAETGTVLLTGANAITANVIVNGGWLGVGSAGALNGAGALVFADAAQGLAFHAADLTISRRVTNNNVPAQVDIDTRGFNAMLSGRVQDNVNGTLGLTKVGAGILTLSNPATDLANRNILGGGAQVDEGTLNIVTGALRGAVTVNNGGTLAGTGSVAIGATVINDGGTLSPGDALVTDSVGTLTFANLTTNAGSTINFNLGAPAGPNDLIVVNGDLSLSGTLNLAGLPGFGTGVYTLFTHTGALTNNLSIGSTPAVGFTYNLLAGVNQLNLNVTLADFYWDGVGPFENGIVEGGSGNWTAAGTNWTDATGTLQAAYIDDITSRAFFQGAAGTVTLAETFIFSELHFLTDGYLINPIASQGLASLAALINVAGGVTATVNAVVDGPGGLTKNGNGTLNLGAESSYEGGTFLNAGRINVRSNGGLGIDGVTMAAGTTLGSYGGQVNLGNAFAIAGGVTFSADTLLRLNGVISGADGFTKTGADDLSLGAANNFTGNVAVNAGTITLYNNASLGAAGNQLNLAAGTGLGLGAGVAIANAITLGGAATVNQPFGGTSTLSGVISGGGSLILAPTGTLVLSGVNSYSGGTTITSGTIGIGGNSAFGTGDVTINGATTLVPQGAISTVRTLANNFAINADTTINGTGGTVGPPYGFAGNVLQLNGNLTGNGNLQVVGGGALTLGGNNALYTGNLIAGDGTPSNGGRLRVASANALGTGTITLNRVSLLANFTGGTITINNNIFVDGNGFEFAGLTGATANDGIIVNGNIVGTGVGSFNKLGAITVTLNGANNYNQLFIDGGGVVAGNNTALGNGQVINTEFGGSASIAAGADGLVFANNIFSLKALVLDTAAFTMTLNGNLNSNAAHAVAKNGAGTLILNGNNGFTGDLSVNGGTVVAGSDTALGAGGVLMADATTLRRGGIGNRAVNNGVQVTGAVTFDANGQSLFLNAPVSGTGSVNIVNTGGNGLAGVVALGNVNGYAGGTVVDDATVFVTADSGLGDAAGGLTLRNAQLSTNASFASGRNVLLDGTFGQVALFNNAVVTLNGVVSGSQLRVTEGGILVLNGANTYAGGTALNAGTIRVGNDSALGTGIVVAAAGTTLQAGATVSVANDIVMADGMTVDNFGNLLTLGGVLSGTGPLSVIDSTGSALGVLTLAGINTYTGGTVVTGTTVQVSQNANLGNVAGGVTLIGGTLRTTASFATDRGIVLGAGGGTLSVATGTVFTVNGVISGTRLTKNSGELVLTAANTYTGGTALNGGTITVANNLALGTGALDMADGTTLNTATNLGTTPNTPTVTLANAITTAGVGTVNTNTGLTLALNGVVSGQGSINKTGAGLLVLAGQNIYAGGTTLAGGTIRTNTGSALGTGSLTTTGGTTLQAGTAGLTVANAITLGAGITTVDTQAFTYTLSGVASGTGGMTKIGSGVLNLSGVSTYTGATTVATGTMNVTGSLVSAVTVNSGAAITGTGTVGALNVLAGGSVNPGTNGTTNTATLTVTGAATLAGTYTANITASANDRITAGGALTLGGTLAVVPGTSPAFTQFNQTFTVASGATRTGTFATVTGLDQVGIAFAPVVEYTATQANLRLAPQSLVVLGNRFGGISGNALEVAQAFDRAVATGYNPQAFFNVYANAGSALPTTLRQMSGEQRATERRVVLDTNRVFRESALDRLNGGLASLGGQQVSSSDGDRTLTYWLRGAGSWSKSQTSGAATAFTTEQRGIITGLDWAKGGLTVGAMFHYTSTDVEYRILGGSSNVETVGGTAYAGYRQDGGLVLNGGVSVAGARTSGNRAITLPSFAQTLAGTTRGTTYQFFGEFAWDLAASADTRIEPFARFTYVRADMGALAETGGVAALAARKQNYDLAVTNIGARIGANVANGKVALNASASYQHIGDDRDAATIIGIPAVGQNGLIRSVAMDRDSLSLQADASVNLSSTIRFSLGYSGLIGKNNDDHGGRATLNFAF